MKYFVVLINYTQSLEKVATVTADHRAFLDRGYEKGWFLASGPRHPPVGGILVCRAPSRDELESLLADDPFVVKEVARHEIIEFDPVKRHGDYAAFFEA